MSVLKTNRELAQEISARIGNSPIPFDSVYSICLEIYNELGGEPAEFDSVYSILLETLPLAESIAKKTSITEVDELPDAQDNNNIYRLSSDDKVYMSKRVSTDYTNRLPDEQLIDKAYVYESDFDLYYYKGAWKIILNDGEVNGYCWLQTYNDSNEWYLYVSQDDAVNATGTTKCYYISFDEVDAIDFENHTVTIYDVLANYAWETGPSFDDSGEHVISATYNAPEADCIGNAFVMDEDYKYWHYIGEEKQIIVGGEQITGYTWVYESEDTLKIVSTKKANDIYVYNLDDNEGSYTDTKFYLDNNGEGETLDFDIYKIFIPQLNALDSEQVGKAYLVWMDGEEETIRNYYNGVEMSIVLSDRTLTVYPWGDMSDLVGSCPFTIKPAYQIYGGNEYFYYGLDSFEWEISDNTLTCTDITYSEFNEECGGTLRDVGFANHTISYTRAIENWEWKQIPTMDDINNIVVQLTLDVSTLQADCSTLDTRVSALENTPATAGQPANEIWYTTRNNTVLLMDSEYASALPTVIYNTYLYGKGVIRFDENLTTIGENAFYDEGNQMKSVSIPQDVSFIHNNAFGSTYLTDVIIDSDALLNKTYTSDNNLSSKFRYATNYIIGDNVTGIGSNAFTYNSNIQSLALGSNVTTIGEWAFHQCTNLGSIVIPSNVTSILEYAFSENFNLTSIIIGTGVTSIGDYAFSAWMRNDDLQVTFKSPTPPSSIGDYIFGIMAGSLSGSGSGSGTTLTIYVPVAGYPAYCAALPDYVDFIESV